MSTTHRTHHQGDLGYPLPLPPIAGCTFEAEVAHARAYAGPEAADDAEVRVRWYAVAWGCPERETTCALARQAAELAAANAVPVIEESGEDYGNAEIARLMTAAPPSNPATLIQTTQTLQEALGELAQRALCSADPAAVGEAEALMARLAHALPTRQR